ncbi:C-C motif chemokine 5-like [Fundulus heteroclitus]|uniref:C-C motif chemokine 5-like n=1 Tax=Fundulus heteroclitus TaxID=8078 RepID=UPI00165BD41D|nr:C-C motif chemokine 5-like [Fundulus heteroclitus]
MKVAHIYLLCILGAALLSTVLCNHAREIKDCCFKLLSKPLNKKLFTSYYKTDPRCSLNAVVLITKRAGRICANPNDRWVKNVIDHLDIVSFKEAAYCPAFTNLVQ